MHKQVHPNQTSEDNRISPTYASRSLSEPIPKYELPKGSLDPDVAYRVINDELTLEGNAHMNLATFVTTWMEPTASRLMAETFEKNLIDKDEYAQSAEIEKRCISIIAHLWNAPLHGDAIGTSTVGSSEACMLAGLALKWRWRKMRTEKGQTTDKPNLVIGANAQICWDKFCMYWDVEPRYIPLEADRYHLDPHLAVAACDQNTIGVIGILGSTLDGSYEPIAEISDALDDLEASTGLNIPLHVDAASGGFVAPFLSPELVWDFRLMRVKSINASGHKYGLVYPGVGWAIWRHPDDLPKELIFNVNYLGGEMPTFTLNFSKPGNTVIAQYYNFLRLGFDGYRKIHANTQATARYLAKALAALDKFEIISSGDDLPVVAFGLKDTAAGDWDLYQLSDSLRKYGWQVPAYSLPKNLEAVTVMRIVVKENFSLDMAENLMRNLTDELKVLARPSDSVDRKVKFHH